jgi:hypothetical protein
MGRTIGILGVLIACAIGGYIYMQQAKSVGQQAGNPRAVVDIAGVKMDLLNIAQAERLYDAREGHYASLEDLRAAGDISFQHNNRGFYNYSLDYNDNGFTVTATYNGPPNPQAPLTISIDQSMNVQ